MAKVYTSQAGRTKPCLFFHIKQVKHNIGVPSAMWEFYSGQKAPVATTKGSSPFSLQLAIQKSVVNLRHHSHHHCCHPCSYHHHQHYSITATVELKRACSTSNPKQLPL